jgi:hypothetical protein
MKECAEAESPVSPACSTRISAAQRVSHGSTCCRAADRETTYVATKQSGKFLLRKVQTSPDSLTLACS